MKVRTSFIAALVVALLAGGGYRFAAAQQSGGAFIPSFDYAITGLWSFSQAPTVSGGGTAVSTTATQTLTNKTITSPTITTPTMVSGVSGAGTYTFPSNTGGMPVVVSCGSSGTADCANTATGATAKMFVGTTTLTAGSATISGLSPAFTSSQTGSCVGMDQSGASGVLAEVVLQGVSSLSIGGSGTGTVWWMCVGYGG